MDMISARPPGPRKDPGWRLWEQVTEAYSGRQAPTDQLTGTPGIAATPTSADPKSRRVAAPVRDPLGPPHDQIFHIQARRAPAVCSGAGRCSPHLEVDPSHSAGPATTPRGGTATVARWARFRSNDLVFQLELGGADRLVDHLPDLPVLVPGPQPHRRYRDQTDRPAHRRINPLVTPRSMLS
jgi:hypothetical protein